MDTDTLTLQRLILPDLTVCTEFDLYFRMSGAVTPKLEEESLSFAQGSKVCFDTYMNLFNLGTWSSFCVLETLVLELSGEGRFRLRLWEMAEDPARTHCFYETDVTLGQRPRAIDLQKAIAGEGVGSGVSDGALIAVELEALTDARLSGGCFVSHVPEQQADADPKIRFAISITTFKREDEVCNTVRRISAFLDKHDDVNARNGIEAHLFVVDNGQSVELDPHPAVTLIPNANLGGAGGFARGLATAQDSGYTHCLFMDDDASFDMENLLRTMAFLRLARDGRTAVAGAMIANKKKWLMWENGAVFNRSCRPQFIGTDLREASAIATMEIIAAQPKPEAFYGGWWYFAFPIQHVDYYPYPFFVRGDDISFSLANNFKTATINGVVSFQDEFGGKESPLTLYLDLRNHLHHHLTHKHMLIGRLRTLKMFWRFYVRSIIRLHYETAEAKLTAFSDIMDGPDTFVKDPAMGQKRPQILSLMKTEKWQPIDPDALLGPVMYTPRNKLALLFLKFTLNGHLVPFWGLRKAGYRILLRDRGMIWPMWGITEADFVDYGQQKSYRVSFDRSRFHALTWKAIKLSWRWLREYPQIANAFQADYRTTAHKDFWLDQFCKT